MCNMQQREVIIQMLMKVKYFISALYTIFEYNNVIFSLNSDAHHSETASLCKVNPTAGSIESPFTPNA